MDGPYAFAFAQLTLRFSVVYTYSRAIVCTARFGAVLVGVSLVQPLAIIAAVAVIIEHGVINPTVLAWPARINALKGPAHASHNVPCQVGSCCVGTC